MWTARPRHFLRCRAFAAQSLDMIVLDIVMPDTERFELLQWLAAQQRTARIVVATGYNPQYAEMAEALAKAKGLGRVRTLLKPAGVAKLRAALRWGIDAES